jgi:hypothetical protein
MSFSFEPLIPPSEERGTEGEERVFVWTCTAPEIEEGLHVTYEARAEVEYNYRALTSKSVTLLPTRELIALRDSGAAFPSDLITKSHSPVTIDITVDGPVRVRDDLATADFSVNIKISNDGGGIVKGNKVNLVVEGKSGLTGIDCSQSGLDLWRGQSQTITCRMGASAVNRLTQARIVASIDYVYIVSASADIEIIGTRTSGYPV